MRKYNIYICHKKIYNVMRLFHLFVLAMIICHIFACCFWYLATIQDQLNFSGQTWVEKVFQQSQTEMNWQRVYLYAFYFSCSTMSTVGYGDVTPSTNFEIWYSIFAMLFSSAVFGYILTYIGDIILDMNREKEVYKKELR
ncbi:hypothetical protein PPERSA_11183 [Pseudocohnilembus persalinus]|uniref:Potassium channel domain-containing protein n=1 Tax=Pseudocohnilembus persalinus TaxID=266149 RepID=A0A0V0QZD9_PSEPJ|nr:hypothetical protein PPERSA_11183 [Pseudocohnilembus persalinus]|eukprot:KRX07634.1 hypothetical protein PPERSA_11183 [Pseudocohnilembus persalinus]